MKQKTTKISVWEVFNWILSIFFGLLGLMMFTASFLSGFLLIVVFIVLFPPIRDAAYKKWHFQLATWVKAIIAIVFLFVFMFSVPTVEKESSIVPSEDMQNDNIAVLEKIVEDYNATHTYTEGDFFVCADMAIDVWNIVRSKGMNAEICTGNVDENLSDMNLTDYLASINHAWVFAETEPFKGVALETTGGYLVWAVENVLYYDQCYPSFPSPREFKKFLELRERYFDVCYEAGRLTEQWNYYYADKTLTREISEFEGRVDAKIEECDALANQLRGLLALD